MEPNHRSPGDRYMTLCVPLHQAALQGHWDTAEKLLNEDPTLIQAKLTSGHETPMHVAAGEGHAAFVRKLLDRMDASDLTVLNKKGFTALAFAATQGHTDIAEMMVEKNPELPTIRGPEAVIPLFLAVWRGHVETADYLFHLPNQNWSQEDGFKLLTASIQSGLYGLATKILTNDERLAVVADSDGDTPLAFLARNPSAFCDNGGRGGTFETITNKVLCFKKLKRGARASYNAHALFDCLWESMTKCQAEDNETGQTAYNENITKLGFIAAESENYNFLVKLIRKDPAFLYKINHTGDSVFHIAISHRHVDIFNLIYEADGIKDLMATLTDANDNNMLHLAARLAPRHRLNQIPGAALQMQHEVLWYKEVEKIVQPAYRDMRNVEGKTPHDLFLAEHGELMKEGEKEMKQIAKSCMVVTTLITAVVFTTSFSVPGGYDDHTGAPILKKEKFFVIFQISEAVATLSSLTSMLMFLSILTSRYTENDFVKTLPFWLVIGVMALLVSILGIMVTYCTSLLLCEHGLAATMFLMGFFAFLTPMAISLMYQLLVGIVRCTYGSRRLFGSKNCLSSLS